MNIKVNTESLFDYYKNGINEQSKPSDNGVCTFAGHAHICDECKAFWASVGNPPERPSCIKID